MSPRRPPPSPPEAGAEPISPSGAAEGPGPARPPERAGTLWPAALARSLERAAASPAPILIVGEPGTGRTTLARELHHASPRREGPLVEVDCGAISTALFESELFGHRAGAFTGASETSPGRLGRARGGTLILDHIEALPIIVQPKLLRLLSEQRYSPLGGRERRADVRFLAIADEDLPRRIAAGSFREDLYYRLEVLAFRLPPLRERRGELERITAHLLADLCSRFGRPPGSLRLAEEAREWMRRHAWPGNFRQLRNLLERALVLEEGEVLVPSRPRALGEEEPRSLAAVESDAIRRALAYTRGHQARAAELLGISRKTLWEKRRRYDIP